MYGVEPVRGPRWTPKRLARMLIDCYGPSAAGGVDVYAVADYVGVTPATVRRWLGTPGTSRRPPIPLERLTQLQRGPEIVEQRSLQEYIYAKDALNSIRDGSEMVDVWTKQSWLDDHTLAIVEIDGKPWHQLVITKANKRALDELRRRATQLDADVLPTRFHAQILAHAVMSRQQAWRIHPSRQQLPHGRTRVWMADAPPVNLEELADMIGDTEGITLGFRRPAAGTTVNGPAQQSTQPADSDMLLDGPDPEKIRDGILAVLRQAAGPVGSPTLAKRLPPLTGRIPVGCRKPVCPLLIPAGKAGWEIVSHGRASHLVRRPVRDREIRPHLLALDERGLAEAVIVGGTLKWAAL
ncbi:Uncharacterised protein [Mycobacteroides abscessus subsp. massiliense]|nr:Uncharacterised protein [Mycobacteroides abscessus subsp. massiliense]SKU12933.1 Uncharacterised protein [Mycobacteroides abscessus subsp. massiliense]